MINSFRVLWKDFIAYANRPMSDAQARLGLPPREECPQCGHKYSKYEGYQGGPG